MRALFLISAMMLSFQNTHAKVEESAIAEMVQKIEKLRSMLHASASASKVCDTSKDPLCSFDKMCSEFDSKSQDFYLYENAEGQKVPNYRLISQAKLAELCLPKSFPEVRVQDPFAYPEQFFSELAAGGKQDLNKNREKLKVQMARVVKIFKESQDRVIKVLESRRNSQNSNEISNLIERVRTVKMSEPDLSKGIVDMYAMGCEAPNAYYDPTQHQMVICPQFLSYPDAALFATMAHEFGHAIDPCISSQNFNQNGKGHLGMVIPEFLGGDGVKGKVRFTAIALNKNPMASVVACLQSEKSIGVKIPSLQKLISFLEQEEIKVNQEEGMDDEGSSAKEFRDATLAKIQDQKDLVKENYEQFKSCRAFSMSGHMQEAFSDWVSSQVMTDRLAEFQDSGLAKRFAFESQAPFWGNDCANIKDNVESRMKSLGAVSSCAKIPSADTSGGDPDSTSHPSSARRIDRIFLANSQISKALGCKASSEVVECK